MACCEDGYFIAVGFSADVRELVIEEDADGCLAEVGVVAGAAFLTGDGCWAAVTLIAGARLFYRRQGWLLLGSSRSSRWDLVSKIWLLGSSRFSSWGWWFVRWLLSTCYWLFNRRWLLCSSDWLLNRWLLGRQRFSGCNWLFIRCLLCSSSFC